MNLGNEIYKRRMIKAFKLLEEVLDIEPLCFSEIVFKKYVEYDGDISEICRYLNKNKYRVVDAGSSRLYRPEDVKRILNDESVYPCIHKKLLFVALGLKNFNYSAWIDKLVNVAEAYYKIS